MTTPTIADVRKECIDNDYITDPDKFFAYYDKREWKYNGEPMQNWKATLARWNREDVDRQPKEEKRSDKSEWEKDFERRCIRDTAWRASQIPNRASQRKPWIWEEV